MMRHQKHRSSNNAYRREHIGGRASSQYARSGRQYFKPNFGKYTDPNLIVTKKGA
jgi:hypothetical protein